MTKKYSLSELVSNRKAHYKYEILETFESGIVLVGTEIKSLRDHGGSLQDAYVVIQKREAWLKKASIAPYTFGNIYNHEEKRDRKLLLNKREIVSLHRSIEQKGLTIIPLAIYLKNGKAKVKIAIAKGKQQHDKRASIKKRQDQISIARALKD